MAYRNIRRKILFEYLDKFKDTPSLTLARILYRDEPKIFHSVEHARSIIRLYRGVAGRINWPKVKNQTYFKNV